MERIQLGIAEDNHRYRKNFINELILNHSDEILITLEAVNGSDLLQKLKFCQPQIILMDIDMPVMDGIEATLHVRDLYPEIKVVVFTQFDIENNIIEMNLLGTKSFLGKSQSTEEIISAIKIVNSGGIYYPKEVE